MNFFILVLAASLTTAGTGAQMSELNPPKPKQEIKKLRKHNDVRSDPYFWLNQRDAPEILAHLKKENEFVESSLQKTNSLQSQIIGEIRSRIKEDDSSTPYKLGSYTYYHRYEKGAEYPIYCRKSLAGPKADKELILLHVPELAKSYNYYDLGNLKVSHNQSLIAYSVDTVGRRIYDIYFKSLDADQTIADVIKQTAGDLVWLNDNKTILYTVQDPETLRVHKVFSYTLGGQPQLVFDEKDVQYSVEISKSLTQNQVYIISKSKTSSETWFADANEATPRFHLFFKRKTKHEYEVFDGGDTYFILTNFKAKNFRLMQTSKDKLDQKYWREVIPHNSKVFLESARVFKDHVVVQTRTNGLTQISYLRRSDKKPISIRFPDPAYMASIGINAEYDTSSFRYDYESMIQPETTFELNFASGFTKTIKVADVPNYKSQLYVSERIWAKAKDHTKIPISIVYRKDKFIKGKNPILIYGYGSYGISMDPYFSRSITSLLDRGFVYAIGHIRGGSELGREWYEDGKLLKKKNTFTDFIAATEHLLAAKYGARGNVYAMGGSAGGLLMGTVSNLRPDLYNGIIAAVPFVDVLTTMLDDSIPLTTAEYEEWGNPNIKKYYSYIKSYSPYDNVKKQKYPNILVTTGYHDSQVQYWEPAKWVAKIRDNNTANTKVLFKTDLEAGHSGTTGRFLSLKEDALEYAFLIDLEENKGAHLHGSQK